ncbi:MAG: cytochrome [Acidimicrobiales bacterium]|jgi:cytochrome P450
MPPVAHGLALPWDEPVGDVVAAIGTARAALGDTFVVDSGADRYLFTFSPTGVKALYGLPEDRASKGVADWRMLRRKLPDALFSGRRTFPHDLFGRADALAYAANVRSALAATVDELGPGGTVEVFDLTRRLGHRVGLASWGGPGSADVPNLASLVAAFDVLDGAESFVHPDAMARIAASGQAAERAALDEVTSLIGVAVDRLSEDPGLDATHPLFSRIALAWSDEDDQRRRTGIAHDVALVHIASMSNLFAALGWALIDLLEHPLSRDRVASGDAPWAEQCAMESTRMAQRSIMSRYVLKPVVLGDEVHEYSVDPGATVATLLPLTNTTAAAGYGEWDPSRWHRRRLSDPSVLRTPELVTVFGHGKHTCPAQPFSLAAMTAAMATLVSTFDWVPGWTDHPRPVPAQIGGVARAASGCEASYQRRSVGP